MEGEECEVAKLKKVKSLNYQITKSVFAKSQSNFKIAKSLNREVAKMQKNSVFYLALFDKCAKKSFQIRSY